MNSEKDFWFHGVPKAEKLITNWVVFAFHPEIARKIHGISLDDLFELAPPPTCDVCGMEYCTQIVDNCVNFICGCPYSGFLFPLQGVINIFRQTVINLACEVNSNRWGTWKKEEFIEYKKYINSPEWQEKSENFIKEAGYRCRRCNRHRDEVVLVSHHRTYIRLGHEMPEDITVLCQPCHNEFHENFVYDKIRHAFYPIDFVRKQPGWGNVDLNGWDKIRQNGK